jgi:hypothetical protein
LNRPSKRFGWGERLILAAGGLFMAAYGQTKNLRGKPIYTNWQGLDVPADFVIFLGGVCLLASVIPWGRIRLIRNAGREKRRR